MQLGHAWEWEREEAAGSLALAPKPVLSRADRLLLASSCVRVRSFSVGVRWLWGAVLHACSDKHYSTTGQYVHHQ